MGTPSSRRRPLLLAVAGGAATVGAIGAAARSGILSEIGDQRYDGDPGTMTLLSSGSSGVESLDVDLNDALLTPAGESRWLTRRLTTSRFSMVGFTWRRGDDEPQIEISIRVDGRWRAWQRMPHAHDAPDPDSAEVSATVGTDLAFVGNADAIRLRVTGNRPAQFTLALIHPVALPGDTTPSDRTTMTPSRKTVARAGAEAVTVPRPYMRSRQAWGADETWRDGGPSYNDTLKQVHVHHTVNSNDYSRADVPALIRGMYRYHTHNLGWSDIGYNFLIDRFGRIWAGRAGGPNRPVRGAHTLGFNATSTGISVIGNYDTAAPDAAIINSIARVSAWKLDRYNGDPQGRTTVLSEGSDKYRANRRVSLPVIDGHRDTNDTACPGQHLYDALPAIRKRTKRRMDRYAQ